MEQMSTELINERKPYHTPKMVVLGAIDEAVLTSNQNGNDGFGGNDSAS